MYFKFFQMSPSIDGHLICVPYIYSYDEFSDNEDLCIPGMNSM